MKNPRLKRLRKFLEPYRVTRGKKFRLKDHEPGDTHRFKSEQKGEAKELLARGVEWLAEEQGKLYAQDRWSVLLVFQAMDAAGKDGTIKHVMSGVNPQGVQVVSFKAPSAEDLDHDFMWRCMKALPERGRIGIFNRSYYEETIVVRVHPELLEKQNIPEKLVTKDIWKERYQHINDWERHLMRCGTVPLKFFLNISKEEQLKRLLARVDDPDKNWKFSPYDVAERKLWDQYQEVYEDTIRNTATEHAPWYVVPCDKKWFSRLVVAGALAEQMDKLDLQFPKVSDEDMEAIKKAHQELLAEKK